MAGPGGLMQLGVMALLEGVSGLKELQRVVHGPAERAALPQNRNPHVGRAGRVTKTPLWRIWPLPACPGSSRALMGVNQ